MEKLKMITDTASDISVEQAAELDIILLPVVIQHAGKSYREGYDIGKREFWKLLQESDEIPTTAQISPEQLLGAYNDAYAEGVTHAIVVTINSAGSGMYQNAHLAKELFEEQEGRDAMKITIIDSHLYTYLYGRLVMQAAQMVKAGDSAQRIISFLEYQLARVYGFAPIYTLKFAKKSGRISGAAAFIGEMMGFKPILSIGDGKVETKEKVRGESLMVPRVIELVRENAINLAGQELMVLFGDLSEEERASVLETLKAELCPASVFVDDIGCSVTNNAGPRVFAVGFYGKDNGLYA